MGYFEISPETDAMVQGWLADRMAEVLDRVLAEDT
jgi:hypothetical protein